MVRRERRRLNLCPTWTAVRRSLIQMRMVIKSVHRSYLALGLSTRILTRSGDASLLASKGLGGVFPMPCPPAVACGLFVPIADGVDGASGVPASVVP